jgi:ABC-type hemin transport system substrate-binding protein
VLATDLARPLETLDQLRDLGIEVVVIDVAREMGVEGTRQLTAEAMLVAAADVIVVTTTGLESVGGIDGLLAIDGIGRTPAGQRRQILAYEDQYPCWAWARATASSSPSSPNR